MAKKLISRPRIITCVHLFPNISREICNHTSLLYKFYFISTFPNCCIVQCLSVCKTDCQNTFERRCIAVNLRKLLDLWLESNYPYVSISEWVRIQCLHSTDFPLSYYFSFVFCGGKIHSLYMAITKLSLSTHLTAHQMLFEEVMFIPGPK